MKLYYLLNTADSYSFSLTVRSCIVALPNLLSSLWVESISPREPSWLLAWRSWWALLERWSIFTGDACWLFDDTFSSILWDNILAFRELRGLWLLSHSYLMKSLIRVIWLSVMLLMTMMMVMLDGRSGTNQSNEGGEFHLYNNLLILYQKLF